LPKTLILETRVPINENEEHVPNKKALLLILLFIILLMPLVVSIIGNYSIY